jgi:hypothetical protein
VDDHKIGHRKPFELNSVKPVTEMRLTYSGKINETINSFKYELEKLEKCKEEATDLSQLEEGLKLIQSAKDEMIRQIKKYFKSVESSFVEDMERIKIEHDNGYTTLQSRMTVAIQNLGVLLKNLNDTRIPINSHKALLSAMNIEFTYEVKRYNGMLVALSDDLYNINVNRTVLEDVLARVPSYVTVNVKGRRLADTYEENEQLEKSFDKYFESTPVKGHEKLRESLRPENMPVRVEVSTHSPIDPEMLQSVKSAKDFEVKMDNFFNPDCPTRFLHFFEGQSKYLYLLPVDKLGTEKFKRFELSNIFDIPLRHRSITTPEGDIFLCGGVEGSLELRNLYHVNFDRLALEAKAMMITARKSHGICYMDGHIYVIGGFAKHDGYLSKCERYDVVKDKWSVIADLNKPASSPSVCSFRNRYVYKFGGLVKGAILNNMIEKYDVEENLWTNYEIEGVEHQFKLLWLNASVQINHNQIYVFGGCEADDKASKTSFIFEVNEKHVSTGGFKIKKINGIELITAGGFWNGQVITEKGKLLCLQNVPKDSNEAYEDKRNLLIFDSNKWMMQKPY